MGVRSFGRTVLKGLKNPRLACREVNRITHKHAPVERYEKSGEPFIEAEWDNLILLDACRFDLFEAENTIAGTLDRRYSGASSTVEFLRANIDGRDLTDTVYVTANGQIQNYSDELAIDLHDIVMLYADGWDEQLGTVPPETVTERAIETAQEYPDKRLLIHYVQPHFPFIGSDSDIGTDRVGESEHDTGFWKRVLCGDIDADADEIWAAYRENLRLTLPHVETLIDALSGKTVITSDHGNLFGERSEPIPIHEWGHPTGIYHEKLVTVPWLVCEWTERKQIISEQSRVQELKPDPAVVVDRLEALGYK